MKNLNRTIQLITLTLTFNLIGINTLLAQEADGTNETNAELVKSSQLVDSKSAIDANTQRLLTKQLLAQTDNSSNFPDASENTVNNQGMSQVNSVSNLSDVQPTDWAFQALQSLVERYGVIAGYPDSTFRGNRALTRYEFAAGLNAALDRLNELIAAGTVDLVRKEDLATVQKLRSQFAQELAMLRSRVDTLEVNTAKLEANQFSTTTKLNAEIVVGLASVLAGENANSQAFDRIPTLAYRARLNLDTSFTGKDLLTTRLQASNVTPLGSTNSGSTLTNEGRLEYDGDSGNNLGIGLLRYRFPVGPNTNFYLAGTGNGFVDLDASAQLNPYFDGGAVSLFALRNPIYNYSGGSGVGLRHLFSDKLELNLGYLTPGSNAGKPSSKNGLFDGVYAAMAQVIISPTDNSKIGLTYINSYSPSYFTSGEGLDPALNPDFIPFGTSSGSNLSNTNFGRPVAINAYGLSGTFQLSPNFAIGGWVGYANQRYISRGDADVWNWAVTLAFPDLGKEGNLGGILVGMEPKVTNISSSVNGGRADQYTSLHLEAFYRYQLTDNIQITPGVIWLTAPNHDENNDDIVTGVVRSVFRF
ncbi:iron uptake porin [Nostoc sp. UHCC 0302]|uniref:iron uptake porin n=1 Tax=Nostoc sp. UHCC 0302 TaxID=3134896 RepID=UPI00311CBED2